MLPFTLEIDETGETFLVVFSTVELLRNAAWSSGEIFFHLDGCFNVMKECLVPATCNAAFGQLYWDLGAEGGCWAGFGGSETEG